MSQYYDIDVDALKAIVARIKGQWDSDQLMMYGPLSTNTLDDIKRIAEEAIKLAEQTG